MNIIVKKPEAPRPRFYSLAEEGKYERDQLIKRDDARVDKAIYDGLWEKRIRIGMRTDWERSARQRYDENYERIDWKK